MDKLQRRIQTVTEGAIVKPRYVCDTFAPHVDAHFHGERYAVHMMTVHSENHAKKCDNVMCEGRIIG